MKKLLLMIMVLLVAACTPRGGVYRIKCSGDALKCYAKAEKICGEVGYEDAANDKFGLRLGAAGFRTEVDMLGANYARFNRGLPNVIIPWLREEQ